MIPARDEPTKLYEVNAIVYLESDDPYEASAYVRTILGSDPKFEEVYVGLADAVWRIKR